MHEGREAQGLIAAAVSGDQFALERLLLAHYDRLSQHIQPSIPVSLQRLVGVEDVLQQTFLQAFRDIRGFRPQSDASFLAWLKTIADHRLLDTIRTLKRKKRGGGRRRIEAPEDPQASNLANLLELFSEDTHTPSRSVARREAVQAIQVAVAGLPDDYREAIRLRYLEGKGLEEIASSMDRTPGAVRGLLARGKEKMRDAMGRSSLWFSRR